MIKFISNIFKNVYAPQIAWFLLLSAIAGGLIGLVPNNNTNEQNVTIFGLVIFLLALFFPRAIGALPKNATDFWYYTLTGIGVIIFFISDAQEREKLRNNIDLKAAMFELAQFRESRKFAEDLFKEPRAFLAKIKEKAGRKFEKAAENHLQSQCDNWVELSKAAMQEKFRQKRNWNNEKSLIPTISTLPPYPENCHLLQWKEIFGKLSQIQSIKELPKLLNQRNPSIFYRDLGLELGPLESTSFVEKYVMPISKGESIENVLESQEEALNKKVQDHEKEYEIINKNSDGTDLGPKTFRLLYWPYFVLTALGLKLARVRYFSDKPID